MSRPDPPAADRPGPEPAAPDLAAMRADAELATGDIGEIPDRPWDDSEVWATVEAWDARKQAKYAAKDRCPGHVKDLVARLAEVEAERNEARAALRDVGGHLDYLRELWGDEAITRQVSDRIRGALSGLAPRGGAGEGGNS